MFISKFTIAVVILAVAMCSEAGLVPTVIDVSASPWDAPWGNHHWGNPWGHGAVAYGPYGPSLAVSHQTVSHQAYSPYGPSLAVSPGHYGPYGAPYAPYLPAAVPGHGHDA